MIERTRIHPYPPPPSKTHLSRWFPTTAIHETDSCFVPPLFPLSMELKLPLFPLTYVSVLRNFYPHSWPSQLHALINAFLPRAHVTGFPPARADKNEWGPWIQLPWNSWTPQNRDPDTVSTPKHPIKLVPIFHNLYSVFAETHTRIQPGSCREKSGLLFNLYRKVDIHT